MKKQDESAKLISDHFVAFLREHGDVLSIRGIEGRLGIPYDTLRKAKEGKKNIPEKYFYDLGSLLVFYGFKWPKNIEK